jgi:hypothetical protein
LDEKETVPNTDRDVDTQTVRLRRAREGVEVTKGLYIYLGMHLIINRGILTLNWILWVVNGPGQDRSSFWPLVAWEHRGPHSWLCRLG